MEGDEIEEWGVMVEGVEVFKRVKELTTNKEGERVNNKHNSLLQFV